MTYRGLLKLGCLAAGLGTAVLNMGIGDVGETKTPSRILRGHKYWIGAVAYSPDGKLLASGGGFFGSLGEVKIWDLATGSERASLEVASHVGGLAFAPDGKSLALGCFDGSVQLWDVATATKLACLTGHQGRVSALAFAPDSCNLASSGIDRTIRVWDLAKLKEAKVFGGAGPFAFSPNGYTVAVLGGSVGLVSLRDVATGRETAQLEPTSHWVCALAYSPDGRWVASGNFDHSICLWDALSHRLSARLEGHTDLVTGVAFAPDGATLASASQDGTVRLWRPAQGNASVLLTELEGPANAVAFAPNGKQVAVAAAGKTIRLLDL